MIKNKSFIFFIDIMKPYRWTFFLQLNEYSNANTNINETFSLF